MAHKIVRLRPRFMLSPSSFLGFESTVACSYDVCQRRSGYPAEVSLDMAMPRRFYKLSMVRARRDVPKTGSLDSQIRMCAETTQPGVCGKGRKSREGGCGRVELNLRYKEADVDTA